jgi:uncharacterized membrane protein YbhN (UPF0104 family)
MSEAPISPASTGKLPVLPQGASGWFWLAVKLAVSVAILSIVLSRADFSRISTAVQTMNVGLYVASLAAAAAATLLAAFRWSLLTRRLTARLNAKETTAIYLASLFVGQVLPSTLGVDAVRAWLAARRHKPFSEIVGAIMVDRACGMLGLGILIVLGAPRLLSMGDAQIGQIATLAAAVLIAGAAVGVGAVFLLLRMRLTGRLAHVQNVARTVLRALASPEGVAALVLSVLVHGLLAVAIALIANGLGAPLSLLDALTTVPAAMLIASIPITINGWGLREGALIACLGLVSVHSSEAFAVSVLFGIGQFLVALPGAGFWIFARRRPAR